jgi:hypothetical protein
MEKVLKGDRDEIKKLAKYMNEATWETNKFANA